MKLDSKEVFFGVSGLAESQTSWKQSETHSSSMHNTVADAEIVHLDTREETPRCALPFGRDRMREGSAGGSQSRIWQRRQSRCK